jgi:hypothetical protein
VRCGRGRVGAGVRFSGRQRFEGSLDRTWRVIHGNHPIVDGLGVISARPGIIAAPGPRLPHRGLHLNLFQIFVGRGVKLGAGGDGLLKAWAALGVLTLGQVGAAEVVVGPGPVRAFHEGVQGRIVASGAGQHQAQVVVDPLLGPRAPRACWKAMMASS